MESLRKIKKIIVSHEHLLDREKYLYHYTRNGFQPVRRGALGRHKWQSGVPWIHSYLAVKKTVMANLIFRVG
jgi:hypothetical protein